MPRQFGTIAFTPAVKAMQEKMGSRENYERFVAKGADNNTVTPDIAQFIASMEGFYLGTVTSNGYPYIQFRGGKAGFLKVLDEKTLGFADYRGNVQYISVGNLSEHDKAFLFLILVISIFNFLQIKNKSGLSILRQFKPEISFLLSFIFLTLLLILSLKLISNPIFVFSR